MNLTVHDVAEKIGAEAETKLIDILKDSGLDFEIVQCCGSNRFCVNLNGNDEACDRPCYNSDIIIQTSNKDVCRIRPCDIVYIAIENRKSAVYVDGKRIETNYPLGFWKKSLNPQIFAQPHSSFLVNLCYVEEVTKDFVKIKYKGKNYSVYTSLRKINSFKKAFLGYEEK